MKSLLQMVICVFILIIVFTIGVILILSLVKQYRTIKKNKEEHIKKP